MLTCRKKKSIPKEKEVKQSSGSSCCVKVISVLTKSYLITIQNNILLDRWLLYFWDKNTWRAVFLRKPIRSWATNPHQSHKNINEDELGFLNLGNLGFSRKPGVFVNLCWGGKRPLQNQFHWGILQVLTNPYYYVHIWIWTF